jgi:Leucine-rich repeat (LRR) protein
MSELSTLLIDFNQVSVLTPIKDLESLRGLYANNNLLSEDSSVIEMNQLAELYIYDNNLTDNRKVEIQDALPSVRIEF